jgi:hypothetical protein
MLKKSSEEAMTQEGQAQKRTPSAEGIQALRHDILELRVNNLLLPYIEDWAAEVREDPMEDEEELILAFTTWATERIIARQKAKRA